MLFKNCLFILAWFVFGGVLSANPLTWQLTSVVFGDGTIVTGSFVFNADTTTFSMLSMTTSGGSSVPATSSWVYNINNLPSAEENSGGLTGFEAVDALSGNEIGSHAVFLYSDLGPLMTNAGGTILLHDFVSVGTCGGADLICGGYNTLLPFSNGSGKFTSASAVPEPSTLILVGSAVILAGLRRRFFGRKALRCSGRSGREKRASVEKSPTLLNTYVLPGGDVRYDAVWREGTINRPL